MKDRVLDYLWGQIEAGVRCMGEIRWWEEGGQWVIGHRRETGEDLQEYERAAAAVLISRFDEEGEFRPIKTAPGLKMGWRLRVDSMEGLRQALEGFYPGTLGLAAAHEDERLEATPVRETLNRQTGMYRVTGLIEKGELRELVETACRSSDGCLRRHAWTLGAGEETPSFEDDKRQLNGDPLGDGEPVIPLICREICAPLVGAARKVVKGRQAEKEAAA